MTAPMTAWMLFRGMPHRPVAEMTAVMPVVAAVLVALGWAGAVATANLALLEHALMMPAMLIPMVLRLDLYTGRGGHAMPLRPAISGPSSAYARQARIRGRRGTKQAAWRAARIMRSSRSKPAP